MPRRLDVIINASSGADDKEEIRHRLIEIFAASGIEAHVSLARSGDELTRMAEEAASAEASETIIAGGGDGSINAVAAALVGTNKRFGVLPLGTLNHFAKDLGIPLDVEAAAQTIIDGHTIEVDTAEVNGRVFLNNSSLGLYPMIVRGREQQQERLGRGKWPAFLLAAMGALRRYPFLSIRLEADGEQFTRRTPFVFIGNNEYEMNGFQMGGRATLTDGQLCLYTTRKVSRLGLLRLALRAMFGRLRQAHEFDAVCAKEIWIETRRKRLHVATDGEVNVMSAPLHYRVRPRSLRVIVPKTVTSDR